MFRDRVQAGRQLAFKLSTMKFLNPLVLGIPRGGIVPAAVIAETIHGDLDVVLAHKLRSPSQPELAFGAVGEDGQIYVDQESSKAVGVTEEYLERESKTQLEKIRRRQALFRSGNPPASIAGRSVILTDDGVATGATLFAAIEVIKAQNPHELIVAIPVSPPCTLLELKRKCGKVICLSAPADFVAVGQFYTEFSTVSDQQVVDLLNQHRSSMPSRT